MATPVFAFGMTKHLGISRSGYHAWLKGVLSNTTLWKLQKLII